MLLSINNFSFGVVRAGPSSLVHSSAPTFLHSVNSRKPSSSGSARKPQKQNTDDFLRSEMVRIAYERSLKRMNAMDVSTEE